MRHKIPALLIALSLGVSAPARAQLPDWVNQILSAALLPVATTQARLDGVNNNDIRTAIDAMNRAGVPAGEARAFFDDERAARRDHGPVDNFGAFVQSQLEAGKRGPELAAAIRAEHARQGKGNAARGGKKIDRDNDDADENGKKDKKDKKDKNEKPGKRDDHGQGRSASSSFNG